MRKLGAAPAEANQRDFLPAKEEHPASHWFERRQSGRDRHIGWRVCAAKPGLDPLQVAAVEFQRRSEFDEADHFAAKILHRNGRLKQAAPGTKQRNQHNDRGCGPADTARPKWSLPNPCPSACPRRHYASLQPSRDRYFVDRFGKLAVELLLFLEPSS